MKQAAERRMMRGRRGCGRERRGQLCSSMPSVCAVFELKGCRIQKKQEQTSAAAGQRVRVSPDPCILAGILFVATAALLCIHDDCSVHVAAPAFIAAPCRCPLNPRV